jgi:plastocyanin
MTIPPTTETAVPTTTIPPTGGAVTVDLIAKNIAFNTSTITVPACSAVTVNFDNQDSGIPHNFAVYTNSEATTPIYQGAIITGPKTTTYTFTAPCTPGDYWFRCDVHPSIMYGTFKVTWSLSPSSFFKARFNRYSKCHAGSRSFPESHETGLSSWITLIHYNYKKAFVLCGGWKLFISGNSTDRKNMTYGAKLYK